MMTIRRYATLPSVVSGYELDDAWSVVVPIARTNEILNPSLETNTTGYTAGAGSFARTTAQQYHGAYSAIYTPSAAVTDGCYYTFTTTVGIRAIHCKFLGSVAGLSYTMSIASTTPTDLASITFTATGRWQWIVFYFAETSATSRRIYLKKNNHASVAPFYFDGLQSEVINAGEIASTYLDGSQQGFVPNQQPVAYYWNGTPHASTSTRSGLTRAGGMVIPFKQFGFLLTAIIGLGLAAPQNVATEYARIDGGYDDYTRKPTRQFTLSGQIQGGLDYLQLRQYRGGLGRLLDRDLVAQDQRLMLKREVIDPCGTVQSTTCQVLAKYQGGLPGNTDNQVSEQVALTFVNYLPAVLADGETGGTLGVQTSLANVDYILERSAAGVWSEPGGGTTNNAINALLYSPAGLLFATGAFTQIGPTAANDIAYWDGVTWNAMSTGLNAQGESMSIEPSGNLIVGGQFTLAGGIANTVKIARWNTTTLVWTALSSGMTGGEVFAVCVAPNGDVYATGTFTTAGGGAATRIAKWDGAAWSALTTGLSGGGLALAVGLDGSIYVGGLFATAGGVTVNNVARWNPVTAAWSALATGVNGQVETLAVGPNGILYAAGQFTTASGVTATRAAQWNGVAWQPMGTGFNNTVSQLLVLPDGRVAAVGAFTTAGGIAVPSGYAIWNGSSWASGDLSTTTVISALAQSRDGRFAAAPTASGITVVSPGLTVITNPGTARSYPTITITGPSSGTARIYQIANLTTGRIIYLNLTLSAGETATLIFTPDNLSFTSDFQGNIAGAILPGSNTADFFLTPKVLDLSGSGANTISFFSASSTVTATLFFRPSFVSLDDVP